MNYLSEKFGGIALRNVPIWRVNGFEAVRSGDLLELINAQFGQSCERKVNYGGVFFPMIICNWPFAQKHLEEILKLDEEISGNAILDPCYHMGVYRKSDATGKVAIPWSDKQLRERLSPSVEIRQKIAKTIFDLRAYLRLRMRIRSVLSLFR